MGKRATTEIGVLYKWRIIGMTDIMRKKFAKIASRIPPGVSKCLQRFKILFPYSCRLYKKFHWFLVLVFNSY